MNKTKIKHFFCFHEWAKLYDDKYIDVVLPLSATSFWSPTMKIYRKCKKCGKSKSFYQ